MCEPSYRFTSPAVVKSDRKTSRATWQTIIQRPNVGFGMLLPARLWRIRCCSRLPSLVQLPVTAWILVRRIKDRLGEEVCGHCSTDLDSWIQLVALQCCCRAGYLKPLNATACCSLRRDVRTEKTSEPCLNTYRDRDGVKPPPPPPSRSLKLRNCESLGMCETD